MRGEYTWKGVYFARRSWIERNRESVSERISKFVDHPPLVERLKDLVVGSNDLSGRPNPRNTMELLERALGNIDGLSDVERVEGLVGRLELRRENLYPAIREEGGLKKKA